MGLGLIAIEYTLEVSKYWEMHPLNVNINP